MLDRIRNRLTSSRLASAIALFALYLLCACVATWPLALHMPTHLPLGSEASSTVPLFNLWTLRWNVDQLRVGYTSYWNAPIFAPTAGAFALSEPQPLTGLIYAPLDLLANNDVLAYNLLLLILALNGLAAAQLLTTLDIPRGPAALGGVLALWLPFAFEQIGVIQLTVLFPIFLAFAALALFVRQPSLRAALAIGGWSAATFLTCGYYGLFLSLFLLLGAAVFVTRNLLRREPIGQLLIGMALAVLPAQAELTAGYSRSSETIAQNSAQPIDYFQRNPRAGSQQVLPWQPGGGSGEALYPGSVLVALALIGLGAAWSGPWRRWGIFCLLGVGSAFVLSLGLNLSLGGWQPYALLRAGYPGFEQLRSPFRFAVFAQIFLVVLAGFGLARLWDWRAALGRWLAISVCCLSVLDVLTVPAQLYAFPARELQAPWVGWLATQPTGAVAMVPFPASGHVADYEPTALAMLQALQHGRPLVNGYSGFFPASYFALRAAMLDFPTPQSLQLLRDADVRYVIVDRRWADRARLARIDSFQAELLPALIDDDVMVFRLARDGPTRAASGGALPPEPPARALPLDPE